MSNLVCIGQIVNAQGIKGAVKIKPALENPMAITTFGPLSDSKGQRFFDLISCYLQKEVLIATLKGVTDRNAAEALKGTGLYVTRSVLPAPSDSEFYCSDLVGLPVYENGVLFGTVSAVENYGAGDILEIKTESGKVMDFSFTEDNFPHVDIAAGQIEISRPAEINGDVNED